MIDKLIASKMAEYNVLVVDMMAERKEYTPRSLAQAVEQKTQGRTVAEMYGRLFAEMKKRGWVIWRSINTPLIR